MTELDLSRKNFGYREIGELMYGLASIKSDVTSLNLSGNVLSVKSGTKLARALATIPIGIRTLDLGANHLGCKVWSRTSARLAQTLRAIPASITSLSLARNQLHWLSDAELMQVFRAIPATVTSLDLSGNSLRGYSYPASQTSIVALTMVLSSVPNTVRSINLGDNYIFDSQTSKTQRRLQCFLFSKFDHIDCDAGVDMAPPQNRLKTLGTELEAWMDSIQTDPSKQKLLIKLVPLCAHLKVLELEHADTFKINFIRFLTLELLDNGSIDRIEYNRFAMTLDGAPSTSMKLLGALMLALVFAAAITLVVICPPALVAVGALTTYGAMAVGAGSVATIASVGFFAKGFKSERLHRLASDVADEKKIIDVLATMPATVCAQ